MKKVISLLLAAIMVTGSMVGVAAKDDKIKNVIYMIPDGGGMVPMYTADAFKVAGGFDEGVYPTATKLDEGHFSFYDLLVGGIITPSLSEGVTDSAAAGTALSSGYKTINGQIGIDEEMKPHANILEACQYLGMSTGMVTTYEWMNATPAAFSSHDVSRSSYANLSQQIVNQDLDVCLGAGFGIADWGSLKEVETRGYNVIDTREELEAVKPGDRIWGNLVHSTFPYDIELPAEVPNLSEMTKAAIRALADTNENGFFLMVEGSIVDGAGHGNKAVEMVSEYAAFDAACKVALDFAKDRDDTMVVILPDHDTGGMTISGSLDKAIEAIQAGEDPDETDLTWESGDHTLRNGGVWMYIPEGVSYPEGLAPVEGEITREALDEVFENNVVDNTVIAQYVADTIGVELDGITEKLFVDVTDMGVYDAGEQMFTFNDHNVRVERNTSYAYFDETIIDLEGQVAVYINDRFYVPQLLLDIIDGKVEGKENTYVNPIISHMDVYLPDGGNLNKWNARVYMVNGLFSPVDGYIKFKSPEACAELGEIKFTAEGGAVKSCVEFECPGYDYTKSGNSFEYDIVFNDGRTYSYEATMPDFVYAGYTDKGITVDGVIDEEEWSSGVKMVCDQTSQLRQVINWKGPRDLSAEFSIMYDEEYFYLYSVVSDENYHPSDTPDLLWQGDSVQFGLFNDVNNLLGSGQSGTKYEEFGIAAIEGVPTVYRFVRTAETTEKGQLSEDEYEMVCVNGGNTMTYELKMKWTDIFGYEYVPEIGDSLGFSALINDNDGEGRRGWIEYGSGIGEYKAVDEFVKLLMLDLKNLNQKGLTYNGVQVVSDVAAPVIDGVATVPVRALFEAAGATVTWDENAVCAIVTENGDTIKFYPGKTEIETSAGIKTADVPVTIVDGRTFVSANAVSGLLGMNVSISADYTSIAVTR